MDAETLSRATEPFFTTKGVGKGTGLGLSMIHGLAKQLNGTFVLQSAPGEGTTASLWLPAAEEGFEQSKVTSPEPELPASRSLKILAVDDDALIRMNISAMLEDMGHEVVEAESGKQALELLSQNPDTDLLITDQAMPNMTGMELIQHVMAQNLDIPIILATGYGELSTDSPAQILKLGKPFSEQQLARAVDDAAQRAGLRERIEDF
jgi:CheY-like chemotaxis protein